jgi:hypothetical protein
MHAGCRTQNPQNEAQEQRVTAQPVRIEGMRRIVCGNRANVVQSHRLATTGRFRFGNRPQKARWIAVRVV